MHALGLLSLLMTCQPRGLSFQETCVSLGVPPIPVASIHPNQQDCGARRSLHKDCMVFISPSMSIFLFYGYWRDVPCKAFNVRVQTPFLLVSLPLTQMLTLTPAHTCGQHLHLAFRILALRICFYLLRIQYSAWISDSEVSEFLNPSRLIQGLWLTPCPILGLEMPLWILTPALPSTPINHICISCLYDVAA